MSGSDTLEDFRAEAEAVSAFHIEGVIEDGDDVPEPSALDSVVGIEHHIDAVAVLVAKAADVAPPAMHINVTIPDQMLKRIDCHAAKHGLTRTGFLVQAAKKKMETQV